jgi:hypothetical protein
VWEQSEGGNSRVHSLAGEATERTARELNIDGMSIVDVARKLQMLARQQGMRWIDPDEFRPFTRNEALGFYVTCQGWQNF